MRCGREELVHAEVVAGAMITSQTGGKPYLICALPPGHLVTPCLSLCNPTNRLLQAVLGRALRGCGSGD